MSIDIAGPIIGVVLLIVLLVLLITSRYKVAGPNQAFIVTGRKGKAVLNPETGELTTDLSGQKVVLGGGVFVVPFIQKLATMDLSSRRISVHISGAVSGQGIKLNLDGVAIVKISGSSASRPTSRASRRRCSPVRSAPSSAGSRSSRSSATARPSPSAWPTSPRRP
jgi:flotillin